MKTMKNNEQWKCSLIRVIVLLELIKETFQFIFIFM